MPVIPKRLHLPTVTKLCLQFYYNRYMRATGKMNDWQIITRLQVTVFI